LKTTKNFGLKNLRYIDKLARKRNTQNEYKRDSGEEGK
jgi:hypothetical protein